MKALLARLGVARETLLEVVLLKQALLAPLEGAWLGLPEASRAEQVARAAQLARGGAGSAGGAGGAGGTAGAGGGGVSGAAGVGGVGCTADVSGAAPEWQTFQGNPAHNGYVPTTLNPSCFTRVWEWKREPGGVLGFINAVTTEAGKGLRDRRRVSRHRLPLCTQ